MAEILLKMALNIINQTKPKGGNQNPLIEGQTTQWPNEKRTKGQTTIYKTSYKKLKIE